MRTLEDLEFLNGLKVERDILDEENFEGEGVSSLKDQTPVKEEPFEEDQEDDEDELNQIRKRQQLQKF
jgi:hypothetical protein